MKTYNFVSSPPIQDALRHYANFGTIVNFEELLEELDMLFKELQLLRDFKDSVDFKP